jgi:hypothetical protein
VNAAMQGSRCYRAVTFRVHDSSFDNIDLMPV